jgi:hypothetical protein
MTSRSPVRPLLGLALGLAVTLAGYLVARHVNEIRLYCAVEGGSPTGFQSCNSADFQHYAGLVAVLIGCLSSLGAGYALLARSRAATQAGRPWPTRRAAAAVARAIDRSLPGTGETPRLRGGFVSAVTIVLLVVAVIGGADLWNGDESGKTLAEFQHVNDALEVARLPPALVRSPDHGLCDTGGACAVSALAPTQLTPILEAYLHGTRDTEGESPQLCRKLAKLAQPCLVVVRGRFDGYPAVAIAFANLVLVTHGQPPKGAVYGGRPHIYFRGSEVSIAPDTPPQVLDS